MSLTRTCRVGVDLGGTGTRAISIIDGAVAIAKDIPTALLGAGTERERIDQLTDLIADVIPEGIALEQVGIGASGPVDVRTGIIHNEATLPWFSGFPLPEQLGANLRVPVGIDNDAVAAAFGEHSLGAGRGADRLLMVTLGTGVGVAMLIDGSPLRGRYSAHPEGGHIPTSSDTYRCYCGLTGCWEQQASRTALQNTLSQAMDGAVPTKRLIVDAMNKASTDRRIQEAFEDYGEAVGRGLAALHTLYQPERTVLGGSAAVCLPLIRGSIYSATHRSTEFSVEVDVRSAKLGDNAGAIGAALRISQF